MFYLNPSKKKDKRSKGSTKRKAKSYGSRRKRKCRVGYGKKRGGGCRKIGTGVAIKYGIKKRAATRGTLDKMLCGLGWEKRVASYNRTCPTQTPSGEFRSYFKNPGAAIGGLTQGFAPKTAIGFVPIALGALLNQSLTSWIVKRFGITSRWGAVAAGVGAAGASLAVPKFGNALFSGGMTRVGIEVVAPYAAPILSRFIPSGAPSVSASPALSPVTKPPLRLSDLPITDDISSLDGLGSGSWSEENEYAGCEG